MHFQLPPLFAEGESHPRVMNHTKTPNKCPMTLDDSLRIINDDLMALNNALKCLGSCNRAAYSHNPAS